MKIFKRILPIFLTAILILLILFPPRYISGDSMEPTLHANQLVLVSRFADRPERNEFWVGEINGFESIKRVVGLPGEFIEVRNNGVYVNGVLSSPHFDTPDNWYEVQLNDDEYFLVGDNRAHSSDSILFGPVSSGDLRGRLIYY